MLGIITFHWADDYGAMLQAYALKEYCSAHTEVKLVPYVPNKVDYRYKLIKTASTKDFTDSVKRMCHIRLFLGMLKRRLNMRAFRRKYLTADGAVLSADKIPDYDSSISEYIVGSDQIWNPEITNGIAEGYFCTFKQNMERPCKCVAYAASIGVDRLDKQYDSAVKAALQSLDAVTVRESACVPYISQLYGKEVTTVLDPVFLLDKAQWCAVSKNPKKRKPYIFVYYTERNMDLIRYVERLSNEKGIEILVFNQELRNRWSKPVRAMSTADPLEFVAYMENADYVVTNSFHGLAFSVILQKQMAVFSHSDKNSRLGTLLSAAGLDSRIVLSPDFDIDSSIDWASTEERLARQINASREYIDTQLFG